MYLEPKDRKVKDVEAEDIEPMNIKVEDIHDIAALRIRAFFPKQLLVIYKIIEENFNVQKTKAFNPDWKDPDKLEAYDERFGNYEGRHYWVKINEKDWQNLISGSESLVSDMKQKFGKQMIEIRVRSSMLLDGWAEVRHDVQYKALGGKPSRGERVLLDAMKGVIKSMEVLLDHLSDVHEDRVKSDHTKLETMELFEQALVRALPHLSLAQERIEDVQVLHCFFEALSIDTLGQFKDIIRKSRYTREVEDFQQKREISQQPMWTFILRQIFMTLSEETINELMKKTSESHELHRIFCVSISWLEEHLFSPEQQGPLNLDEVKRCNVIWDLHEYICVTWPKYKADISTLLGNLFSTVIISPVPRVDMSLFVGFAEIFSGKYQRSPEARLIDKSWCIDESEDFRWHRHDSFCDISYMPGQFRDGSQSCASDNLLEIDTGELYGAILHRAVCHGKKGKNVAIVEQLLQDNTDTNVKFIDDEGRSTLHVATIFSPSVKTVELILRAGVDINRADRSPETALFAAAALRESDLIRLFLNQPGIDVNFWGKTSSKTQATARRNVTLETPHKFCLSKLDVPQCRKLGCGCFQYISPTSHKRSLAQCYADAHEWPELEMIAEHGNFTIVKSFRSWKEFLECCWKSKLTDRLKDSLWEKMRMGVNELDGMDFRLLGTVLRTPQSDFKEGFVSSLLDIGADASLPEPGFTEHMLTTAEDLETFQLIFKSIPPDRLTARDDHGRNALHHVARGRQMHDIHYLDKSSTLLDSDAGHNEVSVDLHGRSWIHYAVTCNMAVPLTHFLYSRYEKDPSEFEPKLKAKDDDGWTPLHWLCFAISSWPHERDKGEWKQRLRFLRHIGGRSRSTMSARLDASPYSGSSKEYGVQ